MEWVNSFHKHNIEFAHFSDESSKLEEVITDQMFNHAIHLLVPSAHPSQKISSIFEPDDHVHYFVEQLPLSTLINTEFVEVFIKKGSLWALSVNTDAENDNCVALYPPGHLILSCQKNTYETLGIQGKQCCGASKQNQKYEIAVDLTQPYFKPGKKYYEQLCKGFVRKNELMFDVIFLWIPQDPAICSSSIQKYFTINGYKCEACYAQLQMSLHESVPIPDIICKPSADSLEFSDFNIILEWIGAVITGVDWKQKEEFVSTFSCPEPCDVLDSFLIYEWRGMLTPNSIIKTRKKLQNMMKENSTFPFMVLVIHGFLDSPPSYKAKDHKCIQTSDKLYCIIIYPSSSWLYRLVA